MPRLLALAIEKGYYDSPIAGVRTRIAPKWLSALPIPPKIQKMQIQKMQILPYPFDPDPVN